MVVAWFSVSILVYCSAVRITDDSGYNRERETNYCSGMNYCFVEITVFTYNSSPLPFSTQYAWVN